MENTRKKSCAQCRAAKTRCNLATPNCLRCERRNISCRYEHQIKNGTNNNGIPYNTWLLGTRSPPQTSLPKQTTQRNPSVDFMSGSDRISELFAFDMQSDMIGDDSMFQIDMDWNNSLNLDGTVGEIGVVLDTPSEPRDEPFSSNRSSRPQETGNNNTIQTSTPVKPVTPRDVDEVTRYACAVIDSPHWDAVKWQAKHGVLQTSPGFLQRRHESSIAARLTGNMVWTTFKRYASEFNEEKLPPFIHWSHLTKVSQDCGKEGFHLPEILANCSTIISMYRRKTASNRNLVNKTLLLENQRLFEEFHNYGERDILHASQVAAFYILLLAADDDRSKAVGTVIRIAMGEIALELGNNYYIKPTRDVEAFPAWEDWALAESEKRTMIALHLLNTILDCNLSSSEDYSCSDLLNLPLPANRSLWEASSKPEWEEAYRRYLFKRKRNRQLTIGEVKISKGHNVQDLDPDLAEDMATWASEADDFGTMMLTGILASE